MVNQLCKFTGYYTLACIIYGCVSAETVCLHDDAVIRWDLQQYKDIAYVYLQHEGELIVSIGSPNYFMIEEELNKKVDVNVTEIWLIVMTVHNINYRDNGTYTCTVGIIGKKEIRIKRDLTIIDPDDGINLYTTEDDKCRAVNCVSNYNVTLLGPEAKEIENNTCLPHMETGIYSCCFLNPMMCPSANCKYIDASMAYPTDTYTVLETGVNKETTTSFTSMHGKMNQQNIGVVIGCVVGVIVLLVAILIVVIVINLRKKVFCKMKEKLKDKEQEESCLQSQIDLNL